MSTKNFKQWILAMSMVLGAAGMYGYRTTLIETEQLVCKEQIKEGQDKKVKSAVPLWESLTSHLIMQSRN